MIATIMTWWRRRKAPTLREVTQQTIRTAESMNAALADLAKCDCTESLRRVMDRARRIEGARTRETDRKARNHK